MLHYSSRLNCKVESLPFLYLGLPLGGYPKRRGFWQSIIDKFQKKFDKLKRFTISRGGRLALRSSVLANIPVYYMSIFLIPSSVSLELERMVQSFFWEGFSGSKLNNLVRWSMVYKASKLALLDKWGWSFFRSMTLFGGR